MLSALHVLSPLWEDSPEMVVLAAVGSPEERDPGPPDGVEDDETAEQEKPGDCAELNACEGELSACADLTDVLQARFQGIETRKGQEESDSTSRRHFPTIATSQKSQLIIAQGSS